MPTIDAFGRVLVIERRGAEWVVFDRGSEGKRRRAADIVIPSQLEASELVQFLDDLLHEYARPGASEVKLMDGNP